MVLSKGKTIVVRAHARIAIARLAVVTRSRRSKGDALASDDERTEEHLT